MIKIAIILVNYNGYDDTVECIESIESDKSRVDRNIIVVDNGKDDQTDSLKKKFPQISTIRVSNNGFSAANNEGIEFAIKMGFDYYLLLNNDTTVEDGFLDALVTNYDECGLVTPKILYYSNPNLIWYGGGHINRFTGNAYHDNLKKIDNNDNNSKNCTFASGCCLLISKKIIDTIGLLSEDYFMYCEDVDYCLRCMKNNILIKYNPNARIFHKISSSTGDNPYNPFSTYYLTRNRLYYIKNYKDEFSIFAMPFTIITRFIKVIKCYLKKDKNYKAYYDGLVDFKRKKYGRSEKY